MNKILIDNIKILQNFFKNKRNKKRQYMLMMNDDEENFNEEISVQNYKHDDSIDLDEVDQAI